MTADSFLFNAGFAFIAAWSIVIAAVAIHAFARDLLPSKTPAHRMRATTTRTTRL
jgi:hypothetical protein